MLSGNPSPHLARITDGFRTSRQQVGAQLRSSEVTSPTARIRTIVVPLDGSTTAEQALPIATLLALRSAAQLVVIRVHEPPRLAMAYANEWDREIREREDDYLVGIAARMRGSTHGPVERMLLDGHPADAISTFAAGRESPLIVMASHGRTGASRFWIGSVTDAVLRRSQIPVLMVRASSGQIRHPDAIQRILVPLDGSAMAEQILPFAAEIASEVGAEVNLVQVVDPADVPRTAPPLAEDALAAVVRDADAGLKVVASNMTREHPGLSVHVRIRVAESAASSIVDAASAHACELVAMTSWSRGLRRAILGSVADKVVRAGPPFILLIRPRSGTIETSAAAAAHGELLHR